jgi:PTS system nitrogen regulatory IIA component
MTALGAHLQAERVRLDSPAKTRRDVLRELGELLGGTDRTSGEILAQDLRARETMGSTGVGGGIAFPHARVSFLPSIRLAFVRTAEPVDFEALDGKPVDLFLALAGPEQGRREYLAVLGTLSYLFRSDTVRDRLREAKTPADVVELIRELSEATPAPPRGD